MYMTNEEDYIIGGKVASASVNEYGDLTILIWCEDGETRTVSASTNEWLIE